MLQVGRKIDVEIGKVTLSVGGTMQTSIPCSTW
jgi:hypothetical protein